MITIEEKQKLLAILVEKNIIKQFEPNEYIHQCIYNNFKKRSFEYFCVSIILSIISIFLLYIAFNSKIAIINILFFVLVLSPIIVIAEHIKKKKIIKNKTYKCFIGTIQKICEDGKSYKIYGLDIDQNFTFLKNASPQKSIQINDQVIICNILDDIDLLNYDFINY